MCDTLAIVEPGRVLFAKNSDRDPNEGQGLEWHPRRAFASGEQVQCTWIRIPQARETHAVLLSRPFWMWGAEIGSNEHGVTIGNEAVFTRAPCASAGLTGMDLLRLALERAETAVAACELIGRLLEEHGQGGGCGHERRAFSYHNSFIVADPRQAYVLETAGRHWAVEEIRGARSISNGLTIPDFAAGHSDRLRTAVSACRLRQSRTQALAGNARGLLDLFGLLRDHGEGAAQPHYAWHHGGMAAPCMHAGGLLANGQTTASWVSSLSPGQVQHWVTGTSAPCLSLFKPVFVDQPCALDMPGETADDSFWWHHERLHRKVMMDPAWLAPKLQEERDALEAEWLQAPPASAVAFDAHERLIDAWLARVEGEVKDTRPIWARRYWRVRSRRAGLS